jgi:nitric oxide synthase-interacting protein
MPAHSKRNTALAFFTNYERSLLKTAWGSQSTTLSRDHFLPFGSCSLCLLPAVDPVACPHGDIFCRECALTNLMAQRSEIKRLEREWERRRKEDLEDEARGDDEVRERAVRDFERVQAGLGTGGGRTAQHTSIEETVKVGVKRKFELDEVELMRIAKEERNKVRKEMDDEKRAAAKHLPSFWAPSQTPDGSASKTSIPEKPPKLNPLCPSSSEEAPHNITLKTLTTIHFTEERSRDVGGKTARSCPACRKALSNISKGVLAVPCGHVLCKSCVDKFMAPVMTPDPHNPGAEHGVLRCFVCETNLMEDDAGDASKSGKENGVDGKKSKKRKDKDKDRVKRGLVELRSDGTGFAGGGKNTVEKKGVAFQC